MSTELRFQVLCLPNVPWQVLKERILRLEELGIETATLPDHFVDHHRLWIFLACVAGHPPGGPDCGCEGQRSQEGEA